MAWAASDIPALDGKVAVVTGANGGLGLASTKAMASAGATVVMAARDLDKAKAALDEIKVADPAAQLEIVGLDLGSQASVKRAAAEITERHAVIDILMNNAGIMAIPEGRTVDGFERQLGVNHFGHWTLTARLLPALLAADKARVVTVTSTAHLFGKPVDPDNVTMEGVYSDWGAYGRSKLANYHFGLGLHQEFERHNLSAMSLIAHPGLSHTNLQIHTVEQGGGGWMGLFWRTMAARTGMSADRGALSQLRAATDPGAKSGEFFGPRFVNNGAPVRKPILRRGNDDAIVNLWAISERETGVSLNFGAGDDHVADNRSGDLG